MKDYMELWRFNYRLACWWHDFNTWQWPRTFVAKQPAWWGIDADYQRTMAYANRALTAIEKIVGKPYCLEVWRDIRGIRAR